MVDFQSFNLSEPVRRALADMGFENPSPIQEAALPVALEGRDIVGQAQTGTGKTAAFGVPLVEAAAQGRRGLVLVPTRELAQQVTAEVNRIGKQAGVTTLAVYGGAPFGHQARDLKRGNFGIVVATPGRLRDHLSRGSFDPSSADLVVLDEADEMMNMGFLEEVEEILAALTGERQTLLFSATMPEAIVRLAERHLTEPQRVQVAGENKSVATANTEQFAVHVTARQKPDALVRILAVEQPTGTLVFRQTRDAVDDLVQTLAGRGVAAEALHGGMVQQARETILRRFRDGNVKVLVATNVAARGLDVAGISHVVNYDAPRETDAYVHRIGRTGRAGREGRALLFVTPGDRGRLRGIERRVGGRIPAYDVPSDADVHAAVDAHLATWLEERAADADALTRELAVVDAAAAAGADPRVLAAAALKAAAKHEGLEAPPLEKHEKRPAPSKQRSTSGPLVPLTFNVGRDDGLRPGDLVGALTNEGGLTGGDVGRIDILPRMSVAEVPQTAADGLIRTLTDSRIRGRNVNLRLADNWEFRSHAGARKKPRGGPYGRAGGRDRRVTR